LDLSLSTPDIADATRVLRETFGHKEFWPGQRAALEAVLAGGDVLAVAPTGAGKSLLYQLPAALRPGLVVVVSPLIALMRDQLRGLDGLGVPAAALHSGEDDYDYARACEGVAAGRLRLLYVSPEGLAQERVIQLLRKRRVTLLAVDEAHCISYWGHEFRREYAALGGIARRLGDPPILAVTASAGPRTRDDIIASLFTRPPSVFVNSFARGNLRLAFRQRRGGMDQLADFARRHSGSSGIIYCNSRRKADVLARDFRNLGFDALAYHAGLDAEQRSAHQDAFFTRKGVIMVATIAFGMGVDKRDVRFVGHADPPDSIEGYYQEIGRAGRDRLDAETLLLYEGRDLAQRWAPPPALESDALAFAAFMRRRAMARLCIAPGCRMKALLAEFGEESGACGRCDHCRGMLALPRRGGAFMQGLKTKFLSRLVALAEGAGSGEAVDREPAPALEDVFSPSPDRALSVAQERLLREFFAARLDLARRRGLPPQRIACDSALRRLACAPSSDEASSAAALEGMTRQDAQVFLRILQQSRQE
jgi:ATP-dependent DNA helicase RecQ